MHSTAATRSAEFVKLYSMVPWHHTLQPHYLTTGILFPIAVVKWVTVDISWNVQVARWIGAVQKYKQNDTWGTYTYTHSWLYQRFNTIV